MDGRGQYCSCQRTELGQDMPENMVYTPQWREAVKKTNADSGGRAATEAGADTGKSRARESRACCNVQTTKGTVCVGDVDTDYERTSQLGCGHYWVNNVYAEDLLT